MYIFVTDVFVSMLLKLLATWKTNHM